jgi:hypothetical protein
VIKAGLEYFASVAAASPGLAVNACRVHQTTSLIQLTFDPAIPRIVEGKIGQMLVNASESSLMQWSAYCDPANSVVG